LSFNGLFSFESLSKITIVLSTSSKLSNLKKVQKEVESLFENETGPPHSIVQERGEIPDIAKAVRLERNED